MYDCSVMVIVVGAVFYLQYTTMTLTLYSLNMDVSDRRMSEGVASSIVG